MKRLVLMFSVLLFAWGVQASGGNVHYEASGTSDFSVTFKTMAQGFAVLASSNPITIIAYASTTAVDTMTVEAGNSMFFYCPANHLHIDRTLATAVTINPTFNNSILPNLGTSIVGLQAALDSPTPVTVTPAFPIFSGYDMIDGASTATVFNKTQRTNPLTGAMPLDGAKAVLLQFSWTKWVHGGFAYQVVYGTHGADTGAMTYGTTWVDSIALDDSLSAGFVPMVSNGTATRLLTGLPGSGYLFIRVWPHARLTDDNAIHIHGLNCTARKVE